jgi:hypothetical protein
MRIPLNPALLLQTRIANLYSRRHNLTPEQFLEQDREYDILHFLEISYESFHLTGDEGILAELEDFIAERRAAKSKASPSGATQ